MTRMSARLAYLALILFTSWPLHAQHGCTNSPENPTAILALIGAAAACYGPVKSKLISMRREK